VADIRIKMSSPAVQSAILATLSRNKAVTGEVAARSRLVRDEGRRRAPRLTGALRRSLKSQRYYNPRTRQVEYRVGWDRAIAFYGWMVEAGTERTPAQPHLRPAADQFGAKPPRDGL
jgi:HK97 gp10 family phage protein